MPTVYDSKNQPYVLTETIGSGGEGTVFSCPGDDKTVAKIYHEPITDEKAEKLRRMASNKNEPLLKVAAWIVDTLHDEPGGKTVGFLMPNVRAKEIHELYSLKSRRIHFPEATWQFLVHTAANLARAFYSLHKNDHVMGDINHGNCVVLADATVKLIDCDSYSIKIEDFRYPCEVGVATHLAPELQGVNLRDVEREKKHDNFGLAVIIFQLLFLGRHPFAGNYTGGEDKSLEDCIREFRFAYAKDAHLRNVKKPPGTLSLDAVSPRVAMMFERAFLTEDRPEPREWIEALEDLSNNLKSCAMHPGHHYFNQLNACPWCEIEAQTGLMLFPFVSSTNRLLDGETFNIFTVENLVASFDVSRNLPALSPKANISPQPSAEAKDVRRKIRREFILLAAGQLFITAIFVAVFGGCTVFIPTMFVLIASISIFNNFANSHKISLEINRDIAVNNWEKLANEWEKALAPAEFSENLAEIRKKIGDYQNLHRNSRRELKVFQDSHFKREINNYLSWFRLTETKISGIGEKRLTVLRDFGIKSAADVEPNRLASIPGVRGATMHKLLEWRKDLERNFQYKPDPKLFKSVEEKIEKGAAESRRRFEKEIGNLLIALRSGSVKARQQQQSLFAKAETFSKDLLQTEKDLSAIAIKGRAMASMGFIAFSMIVFGNIIHSSPAGYSDYAKQTDYTYAPPPPPAPPPFGIEYKRVTVPENISQREIEAMSFIDRQNAALTLYIDSLSADSKKSEQKLRLAMRLDETNIDVLNQLGTLLYDWQKYDDSAKILEKALIINSEHLGTKTYLGMNYIMLSRYADARRVFTEITNKNPSNHSYYNLGLSYKALEDYPSAINAFRSAADLSGKDADSLYEIGYCYYKMGDMENLRAEYQRLLETDTKMAEKLRLDTKLFAKARK